jgi:hypothetical protein
MRNADPIWRPGERACNLWASQFVMRNRNETDVDAKQLLARICNSIM